MSLWRSLVQFPVKPSIFRFSSLFNSCSELIIQSIIYNSQYLPSFPGAADGTRISVSHQKAETETKMEVIICKPDTVSGLRYANSELKAGVGFLSGLAVKAHTWKQATRGRDYNLGASQRLYRCALPKETT
eukprot:sb/3475121/